jgi:hypothetical protein
MLAGCGGTPSTAVGIPTGVATIPATPIAGATIPVPTATRGTAATATRAATPGATRTPMGGAAGASALLRALALVPRHASLPGDGGISFADLETQKRNYGLAGATSAEAFRALGVSNAMLTNATAGLPLPRDAGLEHALATEWREATGYDFWQIEQTITAGSTPQTWTRLEGRFDRAAIGTALGGAGHQPRSYGGATILARGEDGEVVELPRPLTRLTFARLNRAVLDDGALSASPYTALIEAGIDAAAGRGATFAADPDYAALAGVLGPVVGASLLPAASFLSGGANPRATPRAATATPGRATLPPYRLVGLGLQDDGTTHTMVVALLYSDPAAARFAAPLLRERAANYLLQATRQPLAERAIAGETSVVAVGDRATVVLPFAIRETVNLGLWQRMLDQRDYGFLIP